ncbi:TonB-dependent receptor [Maribacter sp.]|uniref:SusC/RagA family TonB-linked outer membrane protein n=1 Tax=Maribacter sp. TaxID=1897614 RepID=UPI003299B0DF
MNILKLKNIIAFMFMILSSSIIFAQSITGTVFSLDGPLPGASVVVKGTTNGTITDFDGNFSLNNVEPNSILNITYLGFIAQEIQTNDKIEFNIILEEDVASLDEVVVVGYGSKKRSELTTAVSSVGSDKINSLPAADINQALEGRATGVQVRNGGSPGEAATVLIRGFNTFGDGSPLYVVDGIFISDISAINPNDIEKVDVLKDAAAAAIYGSRGSNGVIIITTKKGKEGAPKISYNTYTGYQTFSKSRYYDVIDTDQLIQVLIDEDLRVGSDAAVGVNETPPRFSDPDFVAANTNWQSEVFQSAPMSNHDFSVSGATEFVNYRVGAGIFSQDGIQLDTEFKRWNFSANTDYKVGKSIKIGQTLNLNYSRQKAPEQVGGEFLPAWALKMPSYLPVRFEDGRYAGTGRVEDLVTIGQRNPVLLADVNDNERLNSNIVGSIYGEIQLAPGLTNRLQLGVNLFNQNSSSQQNTYGEELLDGDGTNINKVLQKNTYRNLTTSLTNVLSYNKTFGDHRVDASFIFEQLQIKINTGSTRYTSDEPNTITDFGAGVVGNLDTNQIVNIASSYLPNKLVSLAGRLGYSYKNKYVLSGSIRRDADGKFAAGFRDEVFPAASAAWIVTNESFLNENNTISNLKLRASYGKTGNNSAQQFATNPALNNTFGPVGDVNGISVLQVSSPTLTWETSTKTNYGLEFGLFKNKFTLELDYFTSENDQLIVFPIVDTSEGLEPNFTNAGRVDSKGVELTLGYNDYEGDFQWNATVNVSTVDPVVKEVAPGGQGIPAAEVSFGGSSSVVVFNLPGEAPYSFLGYETEGIFESEQAAISGSLQSQAFRETSTGAGVSRTTDDNGNLVYTVLSDGRVIDASEISLDGDIGTFAGDIRFKDQNGDGVISEEDRVVIGDPNPDFTYSFNLGANYKGFDASLYFTGVQGVDAYNHLSYTVDNFNSTGPRNYSTRILDRYSATNTNTSVERFTPNDPNNNERVSDRYIEDGSYTRLKNITLGYSLSKNSLGQLLNNSVSKLRLYVSAQNILTITDYSGYDPEIRPTYNSGGVIDGIGLDKGFSPAPETVIVGLQIEF